jgi:SAM-dependent methyltransferase
MDVPIYYALRASDLGREGLDHSGSYRFADHIYRGEPSGRGRFGVWLDRRLLAMPAARAFRHRYLAASDQLADLLVLREDRPLTVLSVPCGLPRELARGAALAKARRRGSLDGVTFHGLDLDAVLLPQATRFALDQGLPNFHTHHGDALLRSSYDMPADFVACTGFAEFIDDAQLACLYGILFDVLRPGGCLVTSAMKRYWASAYLLRLAELDTHYRTGAAIEAMARRLPFARVTVEPDALGIQSMLIAYK